MQSTPQPPNKSDIENARRASHTGINVLSRVIATLVLALLPIAVGYYVDKQLSTRVLIFFGAALSIGITILGLMSVARLANDEIKKISRDRSND